MLSGFLTTDTMASVDCPACGQPAGRCCMGSARGRSRDAKRMPTPHAARTAAYTSRHPELAAVYAAPDPVRAARAHNAKGGRL